MASNKRQLQQDKKHLTKAKAPSTPKDILYTPLGQYEFPGEVTKVPTPTGSITMAGVNQPLYGVDNTGFAQMMYPENEYQFPGDVVTEYPQEAKRGGTAYKLTKPSKKGINSKAYSRSLMATNRLFLENPLFKKPKSKRNKIFDPKAKYYEDGGEQDDYVYIDNLSPDEIEEYAQGGYVVEDVSIPTLNNYQDGGEETDPPADGIAQRVQYAEGQTPEGFAQGMPVYSEVTKKAEAPYWLEASREYESKNSKQAFIDKKKRDYLKNTNKGLSKAAGLSMDNFPEDVERNFANEYDYKKNTYVAKKLGKEYGFSPKRRGEWVDYLSKGERNVIANSKFESKLQPSLWDRTLAGLVTLTTPFDARANDAMNRGELPGLTKKEQKEIKDAELFGVPVGGLEALAGLDALGVAAANALEQSGNSGYGASYREAPSALSAQPMANVKPEQIAALNLLNYTLPYDIPMLGASVVRGVGNLGKFTKEMPAAVNAAKIDPASIKNLKAVNAEGPITRTVNDILSTAKEAKKDIKHYINNYSNIKKVPKIYKDEIAKLLTPEGKQRLYHLGVDDIDDFMKFMNKGKAHSNRYQSTSAGAFKNKGKVKSPYVNINFDELKELLGNKIDDNKLRYVMSHELGHNIQSYLESIGKTHKGQSYLDIEAIDQLAPFTRDKTKQYFDDTRLMNENEADNLLNQIDDNSEELSNAAYFFRGSKGNEPLPHLRELKQQMLQKGVIKNIHEQVTPDMLQDFYANHKGYLNRILSFTKPWDIKTKGESYNVLSNLLNKTPVLLPAAIGIGALQQEKNGGEIIVDDLTDDQLREYVDGGYIIEKIH
jgi:hypothetical protein